MEKLKVCDVGIVETGFGKVLHLPLTLFIYQRTSTHYTHAIMVAAPDTGLIFDPSFPRLHVGNIDHYGSRKVHILRCKKQPDVSAVLAWGLTETMKDRHYDLLSWIGFLSGVSDFNQDKGWYCSEFVSNALDGRGVDLWCEKPKFIYPSDLIQNPVFDYLGVYGVDVERWKGGK